MHDSRVTFWFWLSLGELRHRRIVNRAGPRCAVCPLVRIQDVVVDVAQEGRVKPVGNLSKADGKADLDNLLNRKLLCQGLVG